MTNRIVLTYSSDGVAKAKREIIRARSDDRKRMRRGAAEVQSPPRMMVAIWSLEGWLEDIAGMIDRLNAVQSTFEFYEIDAVVPAGLISGPERVASWFREMSGQKISKRHRDQLEDNIIANDFFGLAEKIRADIGLDYIVGVTASMVAFFDEARAEVCWNYFSAMEGGAVLTSSYDLHDFARDTGWPFEAFLVKIIVTQLLVAVMWPKLGFHPDTGCIFDFNESRGSLKDNVSSPHIDSDCLENMDPAYRPAALAFVDLLRTYRGAK